MTSFGVELAGSEEVAMLRRLSVFVLLPAAGALIFRAQTPASRPEFKPAPTEVPAHAPKP
jgi:hypothetical protein